MNIDIVPAAIYALSLTPFSFRRPDIMALPVDAFCNYYEIYLELYFPEKVPARWAAAKELADMRPRNYKPSSTLPFNTTLNKHNKPRGAPHG